MGRLAHSHSPIAEHLDYAWTVTLEPRPDRPTVHVPADGRVEVVWSERGLMAGGHVTRPITITADHPREVVGVQIKLGRAGSLLGAGGDELVAEPRALADLWGSEADILAERIAEAPTRQAKADVLMDGIGEHGTREVNADPVVDHVAARARRPGGRMSTVAHDLGYSDRQLRRRFSEAVGFGPKLLQRIERFQRFVWLTDVRSDLARVATDLGYSDESHLARDARELAGVTPAALREQLG